MRSGSRWQQLQRLAWHVSSSLHSSNSSGLDTQLPCCSPVPLQHTTTALSLGALPFLSHSLMQLAWSAKREMAQACFSAATAVEPRFSGCQRPALLPTHGCYAVKRSIALPHAFGLCNASIAHFKTAFNRTMVLTVNCLAGHVLPCFT